MMKKNWLERLVTGISAVLLIGIVAILTYDAVTERKDAPRLHVVVGTPSVDGDRALLPVEIRNEGTTTVEDLEVAVVIRFADGYEERAAIDVPFVPRHSREKAWVSFSRMPGEGDRIDAFPVAMIEP